MLCNFGPKSYFSICASLSSITVINGCRGTIKSRYQAYYEPKCARFPSLGRVLTFGQYLLSLKRQLWCVSPSSSGGIKNNLAMDCSPPLTHMKKDNQNTCMVLCLGSPFYICVMSPPHVTVWHKSPIAWLVRRLQRLQFAATSLFTGHHIRDIKIIFKIGWLLMRERRDFYLLKLVHKALPAFWDVAFLFRN